MVRARRPCRAFSAPIWCTPEGRAGLLRRLLLMLLLPLPLLLLLLLRLLLPLLLPLRPLLLLLPLPLRHGPLATALY